MEFNLVHLVLSLSTDDPARLCRCLSLAGNDFASACRDLVCRRPERECDSCRLLDSCEWHLVFGQKLSPDPSELKRHQKPPLPFAFSFPGLVEPAGGDTPGGVECGLVVVGLAIPHLNMLLEGFCRVLAGGPCAVQADLVRIGSRDYQGTIHPLRGSRSVNHPEELVVLSSAGLMDRYTWGDGPLRIRLLSPLRMIEDGRLLTGFDFSRFARSLMRRVSSLAYYYGDCGFNCDFKALSAQAAAVSCTEYHFAPVTPRNRKLSGVTGHGCFTGDFNGLLPFLVAGQYVHAGKGATFGMGWYELQQEGTGC